MTTLEQLRKAYQDLSDEDKKAFEQSLQGRVDESVAEQEKEDGTKDSQTAKDRVDEAEGAQESKAQMPTQEPSESATSADTEAPVNTEAENQPQAEDKSVEPSAPPQEQLQEEKAELQDYKAMLGRLDSLEGTLTGLIEMHEKLVTSLESGSFGATPQPNQQGGEELGRFEKMYRERAGIKG